jgi:hypothetical protein
MKVNIDWDGFNYAPLNGYHPIFVFLQSDDCGVPKGTARFVVHSYANKLFSYNSYDSVFKLQLSKLRVANAENLAFKWTWRFFDSDEQFLTEYLSEEAYFCHTFPLSFGIRPFVFHVEDIKSMFLPFAAEFDIDVSAANQHPEFDTFRRYLGKILSSEKCLAIFCHYRETSDALLQLFQDFPIREKIRMLDLVSLHREYRDSLKESISPETIAPRKNRVLFTHSYHANIDSLQSRGLLSFFDLCSKLATSDIPSCLVPTLLIPSDYDGDIPDIAGIEIFRGYVPIDIYESILNETKFHFIASPWIHTKVIIDCIVNNIVPICRRHPAYGEYGLSDLNSIDLGCPKYNALWFYEESELGIQIDFDAVLSKMRGFLNRTDENYANPAPCILEKNLESTITSVVQFKGLLAAQIGARGDPKETRLSGNLVEPISPKYFATSPRFLVHARFNGMTIFTNRQRYLYSHLNFMPPFVRMADLLNGGNFFRSNHGFVLFNDLATLLDAMNWVGAGAASPRQTLQLWLSRHKQLYLFVRAMYRGVNKIRKYVLDIRNS